MNKLFISILSFLFVVFFVASVAWINRADILLSVIKYRYSSIENGPNREVNWQMGPPGLTSVDERPPNIILIVADDLGYNDISTFGGGIIKTSNIDRLASQGANFTQSYSGASTCAPSRAMIMTGRYPTRTGYEFTPTPQGMAPIVNSISSQLESKLPGGFYDSEIESAQPPFELKGLPTQEVTIAEALQNAGYYTAHIGKWHLGRSNGMEPNKQGFDDSLLMASGLYLPETDSNVVNAKLEFDPIDQFLWAALTYSASFNSGDKDRFEPKGYLTDYWTDESIKVIQNNRDRPFFLYLAHWGPHTPLQAKREDFDAVGDIKPHRKRVYAAMVRAIDRSVGRILDTLEEQGLSDNTLVIFKKFQDICLNCPESLTNQSIQEINYILSKEEDCEIIYKLLVKNKLPLRVCHNDPKVSNFLFDHSLNAICLIDLDTLMPGTLLTDISDVFDLVKPDTIGLTRDWVREDWWATGVIVVNDRPSLLETWNNRLNKGDGIRGDQEALKDLVGRHTHPQITELPQEYQWLRISLNKGRNSPDKKV